MGKANRRKKMTGTKAKQFRPPIPFVDRPYEGIIAEKELVAMRELIPCAVLSAKTNEKYGNKEFDFVTLLPDGVPAMVRGDGRIQVGLQTRFNSGDLSHDAGGALLSAIALESVGGEGVAEFDVRDQSPRLQDILDESFLSSEDGAAESSSGDANVDLQIMNDFSYWFDPNGEQDEATEQALEQNRQEMVPTETVPGVGGMLWCEMNNNFVRYMTAVDEDSLFTALARLSAAGKATLGENSKFVGTFRACGLAIPVFQVDSELTASDLAGPAAELESALNEALEDDSPLSDNERRVRAGLVSRQVTIR